MRNSIKQTNIKAIKQCKPLVNLKSIKLKPKSIYSLFLEQTAEK